MENLRKERQELYAEVPGIEDAIRKNEKEYEYFMRGLNIPEALVETEKKEKNERLLKKTKKQIKEKTERIHEIQRVLNSEYRTQAQSRVSNQLKDRTNIEEELYIAQERIKSTEKELKNVTAELVSEKKKNEQVREKDLLGREKMIKVSASEYQSWQKSAESKEEHDAREGELHSRELALDKREKNMEKEISKIVEMRMPPALKEREKSLARLKKQLDLRESQLNEKDDEILHKVEKNLEAHEKNMRESEKLNKHEKSLSEKEVFLNGREKELDAREKRFDKIVFEKAKELAKK